MTFTDEALAALYRTHSSVWKVGELAGLSGQTVHKRLKRLGVVQPANVFTDADQERLRREYPIHAAAGTLGKLGADMGRTRQFICRQAKSLGLTDRARKRVFASTWKYVKEPEAEKIWNAFKRSGLGLGRYCASKGFDDLGFSNCMKRYFGDEWEHVMESKQPRMGMYRLGRAFEYRVRDQLKSSGYFVLRSPASKSPLDLLAIKPGLILMVQCKRSNALPVGEWNALFDLAVSVGAIPVMAFMKLSRGMEFKRLVGKKDGSKKRQPYEDYRIEDDRNVVEARAIHDDTVIGTLIEIRAAA